MNKKFKLIFILLFLVLFIPFSFAQQQEILTVKLKMISEGLFEILEGRGARGGVYIGYDGVLLIDSKMDKKSVDETIEGIKKITDKPIKYLINTHSDGIISTEINLYRNQSLLLHMRIVGKSFFIQGETGLRQIGTNQN